MAVANTKSTIITNADATPRVLTTSKITGGRYLREAAATVETAAADDDGSVYRMVRVPSSARISQILYANDAITSGTVYDLGVYRTAADGGAVVSQELFASDLDLSSAHALTDITFEATATDISKIEQELWQRLGLSTDPGVMYDICFTGSTVGSAAGTISLLVRYV